MISPGLKRYLQADLKVFLIIFAVVFSIHFLLVKFWHGGRIKNEEEFFRVPDITMMTIPRVQVVPRDGGHDLPDKLELREPMFLFRPHRWSYTDRSAEVINLDIASVVKEKEFWVASDMGKTTEDPADFTGAIHEMVPHYLKYKPSTSFVQNREGLTPIVAVAPTAVEADFSLQKSILRGRKWKDKPVIANPENLTGVLNPGIVKIAVTLSGRIDFVLMERSSGSVEADMEVIRALQKASLQPVDSALNATLVWSEVEVKWAAKPEGTSKKGATP